MATASEGSRPDMGELPEEKPRRLFTQLKGERSTGSLQHLFGPAILISAVCFVFIITLVLLWKLPGHPTDDPNWVRITGLSSDTDVKELFKQQLSDYKAGLGRLDAYLSLQALLVATTVLVIIRRSDSLNLFGNSIPLSWLHFFIPIFLIYLWLASGFVVHELVWGRMRGVEISTLLPGSIAEYRKLFRDASWIDAWVLSFVDNRATPGYSGIERNIFVPILLVIVLGTLISAAHASTLALVSIGCRRYLSTRQRGRLLWYYALPLIPLILLLISHVLFAYGGPNRNLFQLYVAIASIPLLAFLLWLSARIDDTSYTQTLQSLRRFRQVTLSDPVDQLLLRRGLGSAGAGNERTIALIGDSLSTAFHVSSLPQMLFRMRRGWKTNWFVTLPADDQNRRSVLMRLSDLGTITGVQHASVSALVDSAKPRSALDHLTGTYHFSHQVDEVLTGQFPDILLLWIGHNDVDWKWRTDSRTRSSFLELSNLFGQRYEAQLRRLLDGALASDNPAVIVVFGLTNFESFFKARRAAENMKSEDSSLFPHLDSAYRYFVSMRPEYRDGMIELAAIKAD